ncbi:hypothetical protein RND81_12G114300 [Saponaria officinalis]|uniref:Cytochrome b5 heme-binding domain-containing protein n=1 Tax=Saponaria officinalis TaxID=3572 RepID=A0AAW1H9E8_SAPOF
MGIEIWETTKEAITTYTGLSPALFFTVLALSLAFYHAVFGLFGSSSSSNNQNHRNFVEEIEPVQPPVQLGEITEEELKKFDGSDNSKPLLMAIKGQIYDVSQSRMFYGPGGPYALFAGKDASRALAKMSFEDKDLTGDISGLGPFELDALQDWEYKFMSKYVKVGILKKDVTPNDGPSPSESAEAANAVDGEAPKHEEHNPSTEAVETLTSAVGDADKKEM